MWAYLRTKFLGHCVWDSCSAIVDACCDAWNKLMNMHHRLVPITHRTWTKIVSK